MFGRKPKILTDIETDPDIKFQEILQIITNFWKMIEVLTRYTTTV